MPAQKDSLTNPYHWNYHDKECTSAFVLIGPDGNDAMLATDDDAGQVYLMFQSPQVADDILRMLNSHSALVAALEELTEELTANIPLLDAAGQRFASDSSAKKGLMARSLITQAKGEKA